MNIQTGEVYAQYEYITNLGAYPIWTHNQLRCTPDMNTQQSEVHTFYSDYVIKSVFYIGVLVRTLFIYFMMTFCNMLGYTELHIPHRSQTEWEASSNFRIKCWRQLFKLSAMINFGLNKFGFKSMVYQKTNKEHYCVLYYC